MQKKSVKIEKLSCLGKSSILLLSTLLLPKLLAAEPKRFFSQEVSINTGEEPSSLDPSRSVDKVSYFWLGHIYEGLLIKDTSGKIVPGTASSYSISQDGKVYTFKIRANAKWHDGKSVKAQDFVYGFQRLVDPDYASEYSFIAETAGIASATDVIARKKPVKELGVKAVSDSELQVTLSRPTPFFLSLMTFQPFFPVREDLVSARGDKFAMSVDSVIGNGPFKMTSWKKEQSIRLEKFAGYWGSSKIRLKAIFSDSIIKDSQSAYNAYRAQSIDFLKLDASNLPIALKDKQPIKSASSGRIAFLRLNPAPTNLFADNDLRQAIRLALNRKEFVAKISGIPGDKAAFGMIPSYLTGSLQNTFFRQENSLSWQDGDVAAAKAHISNYLKRTNQNQVPTFSILAGDSDTAKRESEYFQQLFSKVFATNVKVDSVATKARLQKRRDGNYDITINGWGPDYEDPTTFLDQFISQPTQKAWEMNDKNFDSLISQSFEVKDTAKRHAMLAQAEKILVVEKSIAIPFLETGSAVVAEPSLKGWIRSPFTMDPDLRYAYWNQETKL